MNVSETKDTDTNFIRTASRTGVKLVQMNQGVTYRNCNTDSCLKIVTEGSFTISVQGESMVTVGAGQILLIPSGICYIVEILEDTTLMFLKIDHSEESVGEFLAGVEEREEITKVVAKPATAGVSVIGAHPRVIEYAKALQSYLLDDIRSHHFYDLKRRELLFLLGFYYPYDDISVFFAPLSNRMDGFTDFIFANYRHYHTVQELAEASCHSLSSFNKIFRSTFGTSPYNWIKQQRAKDIYYELSFTDKPIKEICSDHGFKSYPQFTHFCKTHFGIPPREMRIKHLKP